MNIEEILAGLDPKTRKRVQIATEVDNQKQETPSVGLTLALKGGFGYGRQILVWGNKYAGKSSFCLQMIALAQKGSGKCQPTNAPTAIQNSVSNILISF